MCAPLLLIYRLTVMTRLPALDRKASKASARADQRVHFGASATGGVPRTCSESNEQCMDISMRVCK